MSLFQRHIRGIGGAAAKDEMPIVPIIMDDLDIGAVYIGTWAESTSGDPYEGTRKYLNPGDVGNVTFPFTLGKSGRYSVMDWHFVHSSRSSSTRLSVAGDEYLVNQIISTGQWNYNGVSDITDSGNLVLQQAELIDGDTTGCDAFKLEYIPNDSFAAVVRTTAANETFTMPLIDAPHDFMVDWGDDQQDHITAWDQVEVTHTYDVAGLHQVTLWGTCPTWHFNNSGDKAKVIVMLNIGNVFTTLANSFYGCNKLQEAIPYKATSFTDCSYGWSYSSLTSFDASGLINVTNCSYAWRDNSLTSFDASSLINVTNCSHAWYGNQLTSFDASGLINATNCSYAWRDNSLTSFDASGLINATNCSRTWYGNQLTSFDASGLINATNCAVAWSNNALDQSSVDGIIDVLADNIKSPGFAVGLDSGTNSPPSAAAQLRIDNELTPAGYTVNHN